MQSLNGRAEVFARLRRQLTNQRDFPQELQSIANVLDGAFGVGCPEGPAASIEGAPALRTLPAIDQPAALFCHNHDSMATWL